MRIFFRGNMQCIRSLASILIQCCRSSKPSLRLLGIPQKSIARCHQGKAGVCILIFCCCATSPCIAITRRQSDMHQTLALQYLEFWHTVSSPNQKISKKQKPKYFPGDELGQPVARPHSKERLAKVAGESRYKKRPDSFPGE